MKYIIGNWKMNMNKQQVNDWLAYFGGLLQQDPNKIPRDVQIILAASYVHLPIVSDFTKDFSNVACAAQNVASTPSGAKTGEVGAFQIRDYCKFCLVGHSERGETRNEVENKIEQCLNEGIKPIVCYSTAEELMKKHTGSMLPVWEDPKNISRGGVYVEEDPEHIKRTFSQMAEIDVIYGGSVNRQNIKNLVTIPNIGGVLPGHASLDPQHFFEIITSFK